MKKKILYFFPACSIRVPKARLISSLPMRVSQGLVNRMNSSIFDGNKIDQSLGCCCKAECRKVRSIPSSDIWISVPEFQKKKAQVMSEIPSAQVLRFSIVRLSLYMNFIKVDLPAAGLPVIQYNGSVLLCSHVGKLDHRSSVEGWKIHSKVSWYAPLIFSYRRSSSVKQTQFRSPSSNLERDSGARFC